MDNLETQQADQGSALRAGAWMFALSLPLGMFVPAFGHFIAGLVGGRIARTIPRAVPGAVLTSLFWAVAVYMIAKAGIHTKADIIYLPPLLALTPPMALFAGAFTGAKGWATKVAGLFMLMAAVGITYRILQPYWAVAQQFQVKESMAELERGKTCPDNLRQLHKAALLYADEYDGMLPPADNWVELIKKNVPEDSQLHCPSVHGVNEYGYAMNPSLGGKRWQEVKDAAHTPLFYDSSNLAAGAHDDVSSLPSPGRHDGHNNMVYLDGRLGAK